MLFKVHKIWQVDSQKKIINPILRVFAIFVKFGLPYLGRYESCPGTIMKNDSQLGVLMNCQRTEVYS